MQGWFRILILVAALAGAGCAALAIGGGGSSATYPSGRDGRSAAQVARDGSITSSVRNRLAADAQVRAFAVDVATFNNVVTLSGRVTSHLERRQAERIAGGVAGVAGVRNELEVIEE